MQMERSGHIVCRAEPRLHGALALLGGAPAATQTLTLRPSCESGDQATLPQMSVE